MPLRVTLADIARAVGVGKSTVARALNNDPHIRAERRAQIKAKAEELGYRPDPSLRVLAAHRWGREPPTGGNTIAVVGVNAPGRSNPRTAYADAVRRRAEQLGYRVEDFELRDYPSARKLSSVLYHRGIRGVLLPPVIVGEPAMELDWNLFSAVGCGVGEFRLPIHSVDTNHFGGVRLAWRECRKLGYERIGGALYRQEGPDNNDAQRHAALYYEQRQLPARVRSVPLFDGPLDDQPGFLRWVRRHRPEAVIALNERAYWWLRDDGYRIPEDIGFCSLNRGTDRQIRFAGAVHLRERVATTAVNWLDQLIRQNETGLPEVPDEILIEPAWQSGDTLRQVR